MLVNEVLTSVLGILSPYDKVPLWRMSNASMWRIIIAGFLAVLAIAAVQTYWVINSYSLAEKTFDEKVSIALRNVAEEVSQLKQVQLPSQKLITKVSQDYYVVNIQDIIDAADLEYYLQVELEKVALRTDFEYGIYDCASDEMVYGNYVDYQDGSTSKRETVLDRYDEYVYYFGVRFPDRKGYVLNNQWVPLLFTALLICAIMFFLYSIYEILKQRKLSDLQKDFINNMTHEFKTPLSSIKVSSEVLLHDERIASDQRLKTYAGIIQDQTQHLSDQVERVLQIAGTRKGKVTLNQESFDLHDVIRGITDQVRNSTANTQTEIRLQLAANPSEIKADPHHLKNVLQNLLDNSIKYSGEQPVIDIQTSIDNGHVSLLVADKGIGIAKNQISNITNKFYRVSTGNVHDTKGFGLGLHYVQNIVDAHGWTLEIDSQLGHGTGITIKIPA